MVRCGAQFSYKNRLALAKYCDRETPFSQKRGHKGRLGDSDCFGHYEKQVCFPKLPFSFFLICQSWLFITALLDRNCQDFSCLGLWLLHMILKQCAEGKARGVVPAQGSVRDSVFSWCDYMQLSPCHLPSPLWNKISLLATSSARSVDGRPLQLFTLGLVDSTSDSLPFRALRSCSLDMDTFSADQRPGLSGHHSHRVAEQRLEKKVLIFAFLSQLSSTYSSASSLRGRDSL